MPTDNFGYILAHKKFASDEYCVTGYEDDATADIQHDLAMSLADGETDLDAIAELEKRGATLPKNCKWVYCKYSRGKQKLAYEV
jgi:hypothetical protein